MVVAVILFATGFNTRDNFRCSDLLSWPNSANISNRGVCSNTRICCSESGRSVRVPLFPSWNLSLGTKTTGFGRSSGRSCSTARLPANFIELARFTCQTCLYFIYICATNSWIRSETCGISSFVRTSSDVDFLFFIQNTVRLGYVSFPYQFSHVIICGDLNVCHTIRDHCELEQLDVSYFFFNYLTFPWMMVWLRIQFSHMQIVVIRNDSIFSMFVLLCH